MLCCVPRVYVYARGMYACVSLSHAVHSSFIAPHCRRYTHTARCHSASAVRRVRVLLRTMVRSLMLRSQQSRTYV